MDFVDPRAARLLVQSIHVLSDDGDLSVGGESGDGLMARVRGSLGRPESSKATMNSPTRRGLPAAVASRPDIVANWSGGKRLQSPSASREGGYPALRGDSRTGEDDELVSVAHPTRPLDPSKRCQSPKRFPSMLVLASPDSAGEDMVVQTGLAVIGEGVLGAAWPGRATRRPGSPAASQRRVDRNEQQALRS